MTFKCWSCAKEHPLSIKKDWGLNQVCAPCDDRLFMQEIMNDKYRDREYEEEPEYEEA